MSLQSMTGFGQAAASFETSRGQVELTIDIKTVNSKYLDAKLRVPRVYQSLEAAILKELKKVLQRGRVELSISLSVKKGSSQEVIVNVEQAKEVKNALSRVAKELQLEASVELEDLLRLPAWVETRELAINSEEEWPFLQKALQEALQEVVATRKSEGESLEAIIREHKKAYEESYQEIRKANDSILEAYRKRCRERVEEILSRGEMEANRLEQEITLWTAKSDYREELDRIHHHLQTLDKTLESSAEKGRRIEFVAQELQRETNTLGSKCADASYLPLIVEMKSHLERIREQTLNVE